MDAACGNHDGMEYTLYADGSCKPNPGVGGWAWRLVRVGHGVVAEGSGRSDGRTTNNRMEIEAIVKGLEACLGRGIQAVDVRTDSKYAIGMMGNWRPGKNQDLVAHLRKLIGRFPYGVHRKWIKGHAGNPHNVAVDRLAGQPKPRKRKAGKLDAAVESDGVYLILSPAQEAIMDENPDADVYVRTAAGECWLVNR